MLLALCPCTPPPAPTPRLKPCLPPLQVDLIDMQSCMDGKFCFLLNYKDDGAKIYANAALTSKTSMAVAFALLQIFAFIGHPFSSSSERCGCPGPSVKKRS